MKNTNIIPPWPKFCILHFTFCIFFFCSLVSFSQTTKVSGKIYDGLTNEPVPFSTLFFKNTTVGANADEQGHYSLQTDNPVDTLIVNYIGYLPAKVSVKKGTAQVLNIALRQNKFDLPDVVINAGENPADVIMRKVVKNKDLHDRDNLDAYRYSSYNKLEFDLNNITNNFKNKKIFKPFRFVFDNMDSSGTNKKPFLPVFITETVSKVYSQKNPKGRKEEIIANKISGTENETVTSYLGDFYAHLNIYDPYIYLFGKGFVSPTSGIGPLYYKYYLYDSTYIGNKWCYKITFKPRRKQELTFVGEMWINDTSFAVKRLNMRIADDANINYIEDLVIVDEYDATDSINWVLTKEVLVMNIAPTETKEKQTMGLIGRKTTYYSDYVINQPMPSKFFTRGAEVEVSEEAFGKDTAFWDSARAERLTRNEEKIYKMADTIVTVPAFKRYSDFIKMVGTGYLAWGKFDVGPVYSMYSYNYVEGSRFRFGGRTNWRFSQKVILNGYLAYGLRDMLFKAGGGIQYFTSKKPRQSIGIDLKRDVEQLGKGPNALTDDNIFQTIILRTPSYKLISNEQERVYIEREWFNGFSTRVAFTHSYYEPLGQLNFTYYASDAKTDTFSTMNVSEVSFFFRFAYHERFVAGKINRVSLGSEYPITRIQYSRGLKGAAVGDFNYHKLNIKVDDKVYLGNFGRFNFTVEAGKIWGVLPYPLLTVHPGNQAYVYDETAFNLMNFYEFVSDEYVSVMTQHHFGGLFLDRIPLLRKLKWREVFTANAVIGRMSDENLDILVNKDAFYTLSKPYVELGVGVENIFKILRLDALTRLSYRDNPGIPKYGVRASISIRF